MSAGAHIQCHVQRQEQGPDGLRHSNAPRSGAIGPDGTLRRRPSTADAADEHREEIIDAEGPRREGDTGLQVEPDRRDHDKRQQLRCCSGGMPS